MLDRQRAARLIAVPGIALASITGMVGTFLEVFWMISMVVPGTASLLLYPHPKLMTFGFVYGFIQSVALVLVPRFRNVDVSTGKRLKATTLAAHQIGVLLGAFWPPNSAGWVLGHLLSSSSSSIFAYYVVKTLRRPLGPLGAADPVISLSAVLIPVIVLLTAVAESWGHNPYSRAGMLQLVLYDVAGGMIFGIGVKTIHFRIELAVRRRLWKALFPLLALSASVAIAAFALDDRNLDLLSSVVYAATSLLWILSVDGFKRVKGGEQFHRMIERDRVRYLYFSAAYVIACVWLLVGGLAGISASLLTAIRAPLAFGVRDVFIHALGIGFAGHAIIAYAPLLLPGLLSAKTPYRGLSLYPVALLNAGNLLRSAWFALGTPPLPGLVLATGALYLSAALTTLIVVHTLR
ncbi:MAG: hypothetical protein N3H32_03005 [Nitrososphaeria archaeon]|nr:hypothetical protein [Nitrososphaeria archaeon]